MVKRLGEVKVSHLLIPDALFISPNLNGTSIYGATLRPVGINQPLINKALSFNIGAGVLLTYAHISEENRSTHFIRPGLDIRARVDLKLHRRLILSGGWSQAAYIPQSLGGFGMGGESLWNIGQGFVLINYRHPFKTNI